MGAETMPADGANDLSDLASQMIKISRENNQAIQRLSAALEQRDDRLERSLDKLKLAHSHLEKVLLGEFGDNGLTSRVMLLERSQGKVSWGAVAIIVGLALSAIGLLLARGA